MTSTTTIADALFGKTQQRVLGLLYGQPDEQFHANEIVRKTFGMADVIRGALLPLVHHIRWAFIYGSMAKNEATAASDIDLMLVGEDLAYSTVMALLAAAEKDLGRTINPTLYTPQDLAGKLAAGTAFVVRVLEQPKIHVMGQQPGAGEVVCAQT